MLHYALNMQGVAGPSGEFLYANIGHAGATSDGYASRHSQFWKHCLKDYSSGKYFFLGDGAYGIYPWLLTPFGGSNILTSSRDVYDLHLARGRQVIERAFGMMIRRWRILVPPLETTMTSDSVKIVKCCVMLHNICLRHSGSVDINVCETDLRNRPFDENDPDDGLQPRARMHPITRCMAVNRHPELRTRTEEELKRAGLLKCDVIANEIHNSGARRTTVRGANRPAAHQVHD
jgi:hypothetical protein